MQQVHEECKAALLRLIDYVLLHFYDLKLADVGPRIREVRYEAEKDRVDYMLAAGPEDSPNPTYDAIPDDWNQICTIWWNYSEKTNEEGQHICSLSFDYDTVMGDDIDHAVIMPGDGWDEPKS